MRPAFVLAACLVLLPAAAQHQEDDQTMDHQELDGRYYERYAEEPADDFLERADEMIRDRNYRSAEGEHYRVQSDDPRLDAKAAVELLEAFRAHFEHFWSGRIELAAYGDKSRAFLFYSFKKYNDLLAGNLRFSDIHPDVIALHTDAGDPGATANWLVHEAAHQLIDRRIYGVEGSHPSPWISEGLASYFGLTRRDSSGAFIAGEVGGKAVRLIDDRRGRPQEGINRALSTARKLFKEAKRDGIPAVRRLLSIDQPAVFYGDGVGKNHPLSWLLVHYMLHGDGGVRAGPFIRYLELERHERGRPEALLEELSMSFDELEAAVASHLGTIKVR